VRSLVLRLPPRWSRRRWSPLQRGVSEPGGWSCCAGSQLGLLWAGLRRSQSSCQGKIRHAWVEDYTRRGRGCHRNLLVARRRAPRPVLQCRCWRSGLAARGPWRSGQQGLDLELCLNLIQGQARWESAPFSKLTSRATHAHPTSPRSTGYCTIWDCISSSSESAPK